MSTPDGHLEHAAQILAVNALGRYAQEYVADHLSPADFKDDADADVRALADAGLLADPELKADRDMLRIDLNTTEEQLTDARRERDHLAWYHAELKWMYGNVVGKSIPLGMVRADYCSPDEVAELLAPIEAERDERQARLDEIRAVLADFHHVGPALPTTMLARIDAIVERGADG